MDSFVISKDQEANQEDITTEKPSFTKNTDKSRMPQDGLFGAVAEKPIELITVRPKPKVDFSIEAILSSRTSASSAIIVTSSEICSSESRSKSIVDHDDPQFSWVYCTRYRPPKLPRAKREINLRNRYRNPRIPFSTVEVSTLERKFVQTPYLGSNEVNELAAALNMSPKRNILTRADGLYRVSTETGRIEFLSHYMFFWFFQRTLSIVEVKIWFQNRRARERREREVQ